MHRIGLRAGFLSIMVLAAVAQAAEVTINAARSGEGLQVGAPDSAVVREWGRHTSAYIARCCFDGPWLLERYLSLTEP
jgi:hypothetical protein